MVDEQTPVKEPHITKGQRVYSNKKNLRGCIEAFIKGIDALELIDVTGEKNAKQKIKQFGESQVQKMAVELDKLTDVKGPHKLDVATAQKQILDRFVKSHRDWFESAKKKHLISYLKLNNLYALAKQQGYNIKDFISAVFGSNQHSTATINKGSIVEKATTFKKVLLAPFYDELEKVAEKHKLGSKIAEYLTNKEKIKLVWDAYRDETLGTDVEAATDRARLEKSIAADVAFALRNLNDNILKQHRHYGVEIPDLKNFFFTTQRHNATKMTTPTLELLKSAAGMTERQFQRLSESKQVNIAKQIWKKVIYSKIDWDKSFRELEVASDAAKGRALDGVWAKIMSETATGSRPQEFVTTSFHSWVEGKERQIFFKSGEDYATYNFHYGTPNLISHLNNVVTTSGKNLAVFEALGPNPEHAFEHISKKLEAENPANEKTKNKIRDLKDWFDHYTTHVNNNYDMTTSRIIQLAKFLPALKVGASLGLNSTPDFMSLRANLKSLNLGKGEHKVLESVFNYFFKSANKEQIAELSKMFGDVNHEFSSAILYESRMADVTNGAPGAKLSKLAHQVNSWGNIHHLDNMIKLAVHSSYSRKMADSFNTKWENLGEELRLKFQQHQISEKEWDGIRGVSANVKKVGSRKYFAPFEINKMSDKQIGDIYGLKSTSKHTIATLRNDLTVKMNGFISYQSNYVIPEMNAASDRQLQNALTGARNMPSLQVAYHLLFQFKNWSINLSSVVLRRIYQQEHKSYTSRALDYANLTVGMGAAYTALNYFQALVHNRKMPGADEENQLWAVTKETLQNTFDQLGVMQMIANQFTDNPRTASAAATFYHHLLTNIGGIVSPGERYTRGDYLSRLLGQFADANVYTAFLHNWLFSKVLESPAWRQHYRGE